MKSNNKVTTFAKNFNSVVIKPTDFKNIVIYYMKAMINNRLITKKNLCLMFKNVLLPIFLFLITSTIIFAQPPGVQIDRNKILKTAKEKYGITEDNANITESELISELIAKGVNLSDQNAVEAAALEIIKARQSKDGSAGFAKPDTIKPTSVKLDPVPKEEPKDQVPASDKAEKQSDSFLEEPKDKGSSKVETVIIKDNEIKEVIVATPIYGQSLPTEVSLQVDPKNITPKDSYVIGSGDKFGISIYGERAADFELTVNDKGYVMIPNIPGSRIYLKGTTYGKSKKLLRGRLSRYFNLRVAQLEVNLVYARTVTVHIMGEVNSQGTQVLSGVNTAFTALASSNGLKDIASVRNIKLIRAGQSEKIIDIYKYITNPTYGEEFYLEDNDYIVVPPLGKVVKITGEVKRPAKYELIRGEKLTDLIKYAAGLKANAYTENIIIKRIENNSKRLINVNLKKILEGGQDFELKTGDLIEVVQINNYNKNTIALKGAFLYPGTIAYEKGQKLDYYLDKGKLEETARTDTAYIIRTSPQNGTVSYFKVSLDEVMNNPNSSANVLLEPLDIVQVVKQDIYIKSYSVSISGDIRGGEISLQYDSSLTIKDLVFLGGGLKPTYSDMGSILRTNEETGEKNYIFFSLNEVMNPTSNTNQTLKVLPDDVIRVYNESNRIDKFGIEVKGAVRAPQIFDFSEDLTLTKLIYMSGGLKLTASSKLIIERTNLQNLKREFIDVNINDLLLPNSPLNDEIKLQPSDKIEILETLEEDYYSISIDGQVRKPGKIQWGEGLKLGDVLILAGGIKPEAIGSRVEISRIGFRPGGGETEVIIAQFSIDDNQQLVSGTDFELEQYDQIIVRTAPDFELQQNVYIKGEIKYPGTYPLLGKKETLISLIERSGGLTVEAFPSGTTLRRSQGDAGYILLDLEDVLKKKERSVYNYILKAGDEIIIPKSADFIVLAGAVDHPTVTELGKLNIPYHKGKRASFYVNKYGQGVDRNRKGRRRYIRVEYPNGTVKETINLGIVTITPKVKQGSKIIVGVKPPKVKKEDEKVQEPIDWGQVVENSLTKLTGVLTLYLLIQQAF